MFSEKLAYLRRVVLKALIFLIPFQNLSLFGNPYLYLPMVAFILYFLLAILTQPGSLLRNSKAIKLLVPMILLWILIFIMNIVNYVSSEQSILAVSYMQRFFSFMVFFVLLMNEIRIDNRVFWQFPKIYVWSMLTLFFFSQIGIGVSYVVGRLFLFGTNPNTLGFMATISALFSIHLVFREKKFSKNWMFYLVSFFMMVLLLGQTASRGAIYSLIAGLVIYFISIEKSIWVKIRTMVPGFILLASVIIILFYTGVVRQRFLDEAERGDLGSRKPIWEVSWNLIKTKPVFGLGASMFDSETSQVIGRYRSQHNEYLRIMGYSGFMGLLLIISFLIRILINIYKRGRQMETGYTNLLFALHIASVFFLFVAGSILMTFLVWFILSYTGSVIVLKPQQINKKYREGGE